MVSRIERMRVVAHISTSMNTSVLNVSNDAKTVIKEPLYAFDSGKEDPIRFIFFTTTQNLDELGWVLNMMEYVECNTNNSAL